MIDQKNIYVSFYANKEIEPEEIDTRYYKLLKAWDDKEQMNFKLIDSAAKEKALTDNKSRDSLIKSIKSDLDQSEIFLLIIGKTTKEDANWIPLEINYTIDERKIPVIAAYTGYRYILDPSKLSDLWPPALKKKIDNETARIIHIPFVRDSLFAAMLRFDHTKYPGGSLSYYSRDAYAQWGLMEEID